MSNELDQLYKTLDILARKLNQLNAQYNMTAERIRSIKDEQAKRLKRRV